MINSRKKEMKEWEQKINDIRSKSSESFDKLLVYLSVGSLILTIGFVKDFIKIDKYTIPTLLILSWSFFSLSLLTMLLSHKTSIISMDNELNGKSKVSDNWDIFTECLNWISILSLFTGIILFVIFISKNF